MNVTEILQVIIVAAALWFVVVFLLYYLFVKFIGVKGVGVLARVLYGFFFVLMFFYMMFLSPYTRFMRVIGTPFWVMTAVLLFALLILIISGAAGGRTGRSE